FEAHIEQISIDAEAALSRLRADRHETNDVSDELIEAKIHMRIDPLQPDRARKPSDPAGGPDIEVPGFARGDVGRRRHLLRLDFQRSGLHRTDNCEKRACEEKQFYFHRWILCSAKLSFKKIAGISRSSLFCTINILFVLAICPGDWSRLRSGRWVKEGEV